MQENKFGQAGSAPPDANAQRAHENGLVGPGLDFEGIFRSSSKMDLMDQAGMEGAAELYEDTLSVIDTEKFPVTPENVDLVIGAIRTIAQEKGWSGYNNVRFDDIRAQLKAMNIPMLPRSTSADYGGDVKVLLVDGPLRNPLEGAKELPRAQVEKIEREERKKFSGGRINIRTDVQRE